jgi:hypothetical protein
MDASTYQANAGTPAPDLGHEDLSAPRKTIGATSIDREYWEHFNSIRMELGVGGFSG